MKTPPLEYLLVCSGTSLGEFELNRLNLAANLRKDLRIIEEELRQAEAEAVLARWLMEHRENLLSAGAAKVLQGSFEFTDAAGPYSIRLSFPRKSRSDKGKENVA